MSNPEREELKEIVRNFIKPKSDQLEEVIEAAAHAVFLTAAAKKPISAAKARQDLKTIRDGFSTAIGVLTNIDSGASYELLNALADDGGTYDHGRAWDEYREIIDGMERLVKLGKKIEEGLPRKRGGRPPVEVKCQCLEACIDVVFERYCPQEIKMSGETLKGFAANIYELATGDKKSSMRTAASTVFKNRAARKGK